MRPCVNAISAAATSPIKQPNVLVFFTQQEVTSIIDNWNMYEEDVMWKWTPDFSRELLVWGTAEVGNLCGNLTIILCTGWLHLSYHRLVDNTKRCLFEARLRLFLQEVGILESCIYTDSGVKSPPSILWIGETFDKQMCRYKGWFVLQFLVLAADLLL